MNNNTYKPICIGDKEKRFTLEQIGVKNLLIIGLNPSTADEHKPDPTVRRVVNFAYQKGFDGWIMFNLYPQRATNPNDLHLILNQDLHSENIRHLKKHIQNADAVLCCWGALLEKRKYLKTSCLKDMSKVIGDKRCIAIKTTTKGHPHHPLYTSLADYEEFDMNLYIKTQIEH